MSIFLNRKTSILVVIAAVTLGLFSSTLITPAMAAARLHGPVNCQVGQFNQLICTLNVSGLGSVQSSTAVLTGSATVVTGCINRGEAGTQPQGLQRTNVGVSATDTATNIQGGRTTFTLESQPINPNSIRSCPDQMTPVLVCVSYTVTQITVTTNSGTEPLLKSPISNIGGTCRGR